MTQRTLVVGDLHLRSQGSQLAAQALEGVLASFPDAELVLLGDALDFAAESETDPRRAARRALAGNPGLGRAIAQRASRGVATVFCAGNHDHTVARPDVLGEIHQTLGLDLADRARVRGEPWFVRLAGGRVHAEHGHVFDPDGAPTHPLCGDRHDDVGVAMLRRFIVPLSAHELVHVHGEAPFALLMRVIRMFGPRAPAVITRYIVSAASIFRDSGRRFPFDQDREDGRSQLQEFAERSGLGAEVLDALVEAHATPVRAHATRTFLRLYLDRIAATAMMVSGSTIMAASAAQLVPSAAAAGVPLVLAGALWLTASMVVYGPQFRGHAPRALAYGAERVAELTGAQTVLLGHVHVEHDGPRYRNTGSFGFPKVPGRRPFLLVEADGNVTRMHTGS